MNNETPAELAALKHSLKQRYASHPDELAAIDRLSDDSIRILQSTGLSPVEFDRQQRIDASRPR